MRAKGAQQIFWIGRSYLSASGATLFHAFMITDFTAINYEINHKVIINSGCSAPSIAIMGFSEHLPFIAENLAMDYGL